MSTEANAPARAATAVREDLERYRRVSVGHLAPVGAQLPGPQPDHRDGAAGLAQNAFFHPPTLRAAVLRPARARAGKDRGRGIEPQPAAADARLCRIEDVDPRILMRWLAYSYSSRRSVVQRSRKHRERSGRQSDMAVILIPACSVACRSRYRSIGAPADCGGWKVILAALTGRGEVA